MNIKQLRAAALKAAQDIIDTAKKEDRDLTEAEVTEVEAKHAEIKEFDVKIKAAEDSDALMGRIASMVPAGKSAAPEGDDAPARNLGEHFVKSVTSDDLGRLKSISGHTLAIKEWTPPASKAATDVIGTPASLAPWGTDFDQTIVRAFRRAVVSDLMGVGTISGNAVTYIVEGAVEGAFSTVAAGGAKPQLSIADPTTATDALKKIAGFMKFTDEMVEDFPFWASEINQRGLYLLALAEENQLLNGPGTGSTVLGLLNRSGIQTETAAAGGKDNADALFRAMTKVQTATGLSADAIIINPIDYQALRLSKDGNDQYYGGGYFSGQYGVGGVVEQPPLWGMPTVVTSAVAVGTAVVGALKASTTVYRKGGVRVESTNSHVGDFTNNLITTRIEERVALADRIPAATVKVTLTAAA